MPVLAAAAAAVFSSAVTFASAVGTAALASAGLGGIAGMGIASFTGSLTIGTLVGAVSIGSTAMSLFSAAKKPKAGAGSASPVAWKADPNAYIPFVAGGPVGVGGNQVFAQTAGSKNRWLQFVTVLSHGGPVQSVTPFKANDEVVNFTRDGGQGAEGRYKDRMWMRNALGAIGAAATIITASGTKYTPGPNGGNPPEWTANHKLSGMAHSVMSMWSDPERIPQIPKALWHVVGGPVYDPRKDSTQPGGDGPQRWNDRTTWSLTGNTNPYLQALTFTIGHTFGGVRVGGVGVPLSGIDVPAFVYGANVADANGWKIAWQWHTGMRKWDVLATMLQAGGGLPLVRGSKISCMVDAPRVSIGTITDADLRGDFSVTGCASIRDRKNAIVPRCKSAAHNWTVQPHGRVASAVYLAEDGGVERPVEVEYEAVADPVQVRQLAALELANLREGLAATIPVSASFLKYRAGDCLTMQAGSTLLTGQKIVVVKREFDHKSRIVQLTVRSETDGKHAWAMGQAADPPPSPTLVGADPTVIQPPAPDAWVPSPGTFPGGGDDTSPGDPQAPVIVICPAEPGDGAGADDPAATEVIVRYRRMGNDPWTGSPYEWSHQSFPARADRLELTGLAPETTYELEVAYKVRGITSAFTAYGQVTTGALRATDADALGGRAAQQVLDDLDAVPGQIDDALAAADAALSAAVGNLNTALGQLDGRLDTVEFDLNTPSTGLKARVGTVETVAANAASRIGVVEVQINTAGTGLLARTASLETATANLQTGKADASRVTTLEARARAQDGQLFADRYDGSSASYFVNNPIGGITTLTDLPSNATQAGYGPVRDVTGAAGTEDFATRGAVPAIPGRIYRFQGEFQRTAFTGPGTTGSVAVVARCLNADMTADAGGGVASTTVLDGTVQTATLLVSDVASPGVSAWPAGTVWIRPYMRQSYGSNTAQTVRMRRLTVTDVTNDQALAARATSLETATANLQTGKADASRVTTLEARATSASRGAALFPNPDFSAWADATYAPTNWSGGANGPAAVTRVTGDGGRPYAARFTCPGTEPLALLTDRTPATEGWYVIEAEYTLESGSLSGMLFILRGDTADPLYVHELALRPFVVHGAGTVGRRYQDTEVVQLLNSNVPGRTITNVYLMAYANGSAYYGSGGAAAAKTVTVHRVTARPATASEIELRQARGAASSVAARFVAAETATADLVTGKADASRVTLLESQVQTPTTGLLARTTSLETATANLQTGKADASRVTAVEASISGKGWLNRNAEFTTYTTTTTPDFWGLGNQIGLTGNSARVTGERGNYAWRMTAPTGVEVGAASYTEDGTFRAGQWFVVEAEFTLVSGTLNRAGVYAPFYSANSAQSNDSQSYFNFATLPDSTGVAPGAGVPGRRYRYAFPPRQIPNTAATDQLSRCLFYAFAGWIGFGSMAGQAAVIDWHLCGIRAASRAEIETGAAIAGGTSLSARFVSLETATANLQTGKADASRVTTVEARLNAGGAWENFDDGLNGWNNGLGPSVANWPAGTVQATYQGRRNVFVPNALVATNLYSNEFIPVDTSRKYAVHVGLHVPAGGNPVETYVGLRCRDAAGNIIFSNPGSYLYAAVVGHIGSAAGGWLDIRSNVAFPNVPVGAQGPITGEGTGTWAIFPVGTKSVELLLFLQNNGANGRTTAVDYVRLVDITDGEAVTSLAARVTTEEAATVDLYGRTQARWAIGAAVPGADAFIEARAETSPGSPPTSSVAIGARQFAVFNPVGSAWLKALDVQNGNVVLTGGLNVGAFIRLGNGNGWPVALKAVDFSAADGEVVSFGTDLGTIPSLSFAMNNLAPLTAGETYDVKATGLSPTGFTLSAKINVPATPAAQSVTTGQAAVTINSKSGIQIGLQSKPDSADGTFTITATGSQSHRFTGTGGGAFQPPEYDAATTYLLVYAKKAGVWQLVANLQAETAVDITEYDSPQNGGPFQWTVDAAWSLPATQITVGSGATDIAVVRDYASNGRTGYVGNIPSVEWQSQGAGSGVRSATPSGQKTRITVRPQ